LLPTRVREVDFFDTFNIDELNLIVWNTGSLLHQAQQATAFNFGAPNNDDATFRAFKMRFTEKVEEMLSWVSDGHTLLLIPYQFPLLKYAAPDGQSGSEDLHYYSAFSVVTIQRLSGELVVTQSVFEEFSEVTSLLKYDYVMSGPNVIPVFRSSSNREQR